MNDSSPYIALDRVSQVFTTTDRDSVEALADVSVSVRRNEFVAVVGPSGCGKSTLLRIVAGLLQPSAGSVQIAGREVVEPHDDIGIVFQRPTLLAWLRVIDNVLFPLVHKYGRTDAGQRLHAEALLATMGLEAFANRMPDELSGGMQQRVALARALVQDPHILLMDEPFSALDALTRDIMALEVLRVWEERPKSVIFVTHSIPEALLLSDRVVVMTARPGRIAEVVDVNLARPRGLATMGDPLFNELSQRLRAHILGTIPAVA
ncbi:MAG: ABC transporter ATP-binding protein [Candidatus Lustribacter sp.]